MHGEYEQHCERLHMIRGWDGKGCVSVVWAGIATISYENVKGNNEEHQCEGKRKSLLLRKIKHFV